MDIRVSNLLVMLRLGLAVSDVKVRVREGDGFYWVWTPSLPDFGILHCIMGTELGSRAKGVSRGRHWPVRI